MADISWIKIDTDMFDNKKIKYLRSLPDGNSIALFWIMLLTLAGKCNENGDVFLSKKIKFSEKSLANELNFKESFVKKALGILSDLDMITLGEAIHITGWEEHQNTEGMEKIREQNRIRKQNQRERERHQESQNTSRDGHAMSRDSHATEEEIEEDIDTYIEGSSINNNNIRVSDVIDTQATPSKKRLPYPPTLEMIQTYANSKGLSHVNCTRFFNFWAERKWLKKGEKFDWRPVLSEWDESDKKKVQQQPKPPDDMINHNYTEEFWEERRRRAMNSL